MFYDKARIYVKAGSGGNGVVAFRARNMSHAAGRMAATAGAAAT
jgi:GTPase involved in cell partitioning and DNA repair